METSPALKRRKIRKGTQSCWQCKRRKIRCTFAAPNDVVCDGCRSRQVKCISQEFHEESTVTDVQASTVDGSEHLVARLAAHHDTDTSIHTLHVSQSTRAEALHGPVSNARTASVSTNSPAQIRDTPSPSIQVKGKYDELSKSLLLAWPCSRDLELIMSVEVGSSVLFHGTVCMPYSKFLSGDLPSQREILRLPPSGSHPVLIARKLLLLGLFLQGISPKSMKELGRLGVDCEQIMSCIVDTANRVVTSNDDLVNSLEGIECIMIESVYQNNAGKLRRAWLINRRTMAIAQMMGLHAGAPLSCKMLDLQTRERIDPDYVWLRLVMLDRYLSLMLGLPQCSQESLFATPQALQECTPIERMERLGTAIGGLILQRNREDLHNFETTCEIDKMLQDAAASMPADWWLVPSTDTITGSDSNSLRETIRVTNQFAHYHTLAQLHLPYLLYSSTDRKYDYSKITTVHASREILLRYMCFHSSEVITAYCRGIDFLAFIASTILCLAHIDRHRQGQTVPKNSTNVLQFLAHQRPSDRGLMERTLKVMEDMVRVKNDAIARKIAAILKRLLLVEAAARDGCYYSTVSHQSSEQIFSDSDGNNNDASDILSIGIPHFGTIRIEHSSGVQYPKVAHKPWSGNSSSCPTLATSQPTIGSWFEPISSLTFTEQHIEPEKRPCTVHTSHHQTKDQYFQVGLQSAAPDLPFAQPLGEFQTGMSSAELCSFNHDVASTGNLPISGPLIDEDDWTLQGVDMHLFDSLFEWQRND